MKTLAGTIKILEKQNGGELKGKLEFFKTKNWKYCTGKYNKNIKERGGFVDRVFEDDKGCIVWYKQQSDRDGSYLRMKCVENYYLTIREKVSYKRALEIAKTTKCLGEF